MYFYIIYIQLYVFIYECVLLHDFQGALFNRFSANAVSFIQGADSAEVYQYIYSYIYT